MSEDSLFLEKLKSMKCKVTIYYLTLHKAILMKTNINLIQISYSQDNKIQHELTRDLSVIFPDSTQIAGRLFLRCPMYCTPFRIK